MKSTICMGLAVFFCSFYYNVPSKAIPSIVVCGLAGYGIYYFMDHALAMPYMGYLLGIMALGLLAGIFARQYKLPTTVYIVPSMIPLVPGRALYNMMYNIVLGNYAEAATHGARAIMIAAILAIGIYLTSALSDFIKLRNILRRR